jgi:hypothetical protein
MVGGESSKGKKKKKREREIGGTLLAQYSLTLAMPLKMRRGGGKNESTFRVLFLPSMRTWLGYPPQNLRRVWRDKENTSASRVPPFSFFSLYLLFIDLFLNLTRVSHLHYLAPFSNTDIIARKDFLYAERSLPYKGKNKNNVAKNTSADVRLILKWIPSFA